MRTRHATRTLARWLAATCLLAPALHALPLQARGAYDPIVLPATAPPHPNDPLRSKLLLFVPGGKVPPSDYVPFVRAAIDASASHLVGVIVSCGALNLCDPLGQLPGLMRDAITAAAKAANNGVAFKNKDIFVLGHSLGGVGARHFVDTAAAPGPAAFAGLAMFGTQYNGDHEDFKGTLGYPTDLAGFPTPVLALLGELDMLPISHAAILHGQHAALPPAQRASKAVVIVPGMDHSQFCSPFNVSGDLVPEISNEAALAAASSVLAAWLDVVAQPTSARGASAEAEVLAWVANSTVPITAAYLAARDVEESTWCSLAQTVLLGGLDAGVVASRVNVSEVLVVRADNGSAALEHAHTKYSFTPQPGNRGPPTLELTIASYAFRAELSSWNPVSVFAPTYASARDISCKLVSADRVAQQLNLAGHFPLKSPQVSCEAIDRAAVQMATDLLSQHWPAAMERHTRRGRGFAVDKDSSTFAGPQWVFASSLKFDVGKSGSGDPVEVQSSSLYSSISSPIFPGNHYCKVLSPAKAVEWVQTKGVLGLLP